jgi:hypothetical protein
MRRIRRALLVVAAMGVTLPFVPGTAGAQQEPQLVDATLDYLCAEVGTVAVRVTATLPAAGKTGEPVEPTDVGIEVTVPSAALAGLPGAASVTSLARLDVAPETWSAVLSEPTPLTDPVVLGGDVTAPAVTPSGAGDLAFDVGTLAMRVTGYTAEGVPTEPPSVDLTCVLGPEESASLAVVPVARPDGKTTEETPPPASADEPAQRAPEVGILAAPPPECYRIPEATAEYTDPYCSYLTGFSNIAKLNTSILQPAGYVNIVATKYRSDCKEGTGIRCQDAVTKPELNGKPQLPPAPGSFFAFGFIPVTGTVQLTQIDLAHVYLWSTAVRPYRGLATIRVKLSAQILNEPPEFQPKVNGVPLDVGPNCRTAEPIDAVFTGTYDEYSVTLGGVLRGTVEIPPFSGCGANEDLDPLFTNLVSGPGNYVKLTQGAVCYITGNNRGCPPVKPEPKR